MVHGEAQAFGSLNHPEPNTESNQYQAHFSLWPLHTLKLSFKMSGVLVYAPQIFLSVTHI